ncbi:B12-binding domain-containing radical SAM protein [Planctomycetota bacterium]
MKKLKFLFVQPDYPRQYVFFFPVYEPLHGLLFGALVEDLAETCIFDRRYETDENLKKVMEDFDPDIVGITTHTAGELYNVERLLRVIKDAKPETVTIVGGQHATLLPEDFYSPDVDLICIGPGEETFREVMETLAQGKKDFTDVSGLAVNQGDEYLLTEPRIIESGTFSWPRFDRSLLDKYKKHYLNFFEFRPTVYTLTTSGCPYRCKFCSLWVAARGTYRRRDPEEIVNDIANQPQTFVHLTDDNTFHNEDHAMEIYRLLKKRGVKKKILAYARTDTIMNKTDLLEKWKEIGLGALVVGMEACTDGHLDYINKKTNVDINIKANKVLDELEIENWAHFVIMPDFEKEDFDRIHEFIEKLNICYPIFVPLTPVPGTPLFFEAKAKGEITSYDYGFYTLQYMTMKTKIPKQEWYNHLTDLYFKTCSVKALWKRRKSGQYHLRPMLGRAFIMKRCMKKMNVFMKEQIEHEQNFNYEASESLLPPSLRKGYKLDKYYNELTLKTLNKEENPEPAQV